MNRMKAKQYLLIVLVGLTLFLAGYIIGKGDAERPDIEVETIETTVDTLGYRAPIPQSESVSGTRLYSMPVYRTPGGGAGREPRQCGSADSTCVGTAITETIRADAGDGHRDSAIVELPIIQRHYADSAYEAWVSGPVDPRLDSVRVYAKRTVVNRREWKPPKRWHLGVTAGYGYGAKGFQPYIGVGVTYSLYSF